jgi:hypothetical protein
MNPMLHRRILLIGFPFLISMAAPSALDAQSSCTDYLSSINSCPPSNSCSQKNFDLDVPNGEGYFVMLPMNSSARCGQVNGTTYRVGGECDAVPLTPEAEMQLIKVAKITPLLIANCAGESVQFTGATSPGRKPNQIQIDKIKF